MRKLMASPTQSQPLSAAAAPTPHLIYYGGRIVSDTQVVQVLWGSGSYLTQVTNTADPSMATFYQEILNSPYVDWLVEYDTATTPSGGGQGTDQNIMYGAFVGQFTITPSNRSNPIDDSAIQVELANQIAAGNLPAPTLDSQGNPQTYYALFFPYGQVITAGSYTSCVDFCAYHGTIASVAVGGKSYEIYYGVHPDMQSGSGCEFGCGSAATAFGNYTSVASHEMIETITDGEVGLAATYSPPLAWYDQNYGEIGDICNANQGSVVGPYDGVSYVVQKEWSNRVGSCITTSSTTPDFTLDVSPSSANLAPGATATFSVTANIKSGSPGSITFGAVGLPSGVTSGFAPPSLIPNGSSTLTLTASGGTTLGSQTFTVTAAGTINHSAQASVNVTKATASATPTATATASVAATPTATVTPTPTATATPTPTATATPTTTATATQTTKSTVTPTATPAPTVTATATMTATVTATPTATATPPPTIMTIAPLTFDFRNVTATASSKQHLFTVTNRGALPGTVDSLRAAQTMEPASSFKVVTDHCSGVTVDPKRTCNVGVSFAPASVDGAEIGTVAIAYNGGTASVTLLGNSVAAVLSAPKSVTLRGAALGRTGPARTIRIANHSAASVTLGAAPLLSSCDFGIAGDTCTGATLAHGQTCTVGVETTPCGGAVKGQMLSGTLTYPFSYGSNGGNVSLTLKSKVW